MMSDPELEQWSSLFRSQEIDPAEIAARARKAVRNFRLWIYSEIAVTILMGGGAIAWALEAHSPSVTALAVWIWVSLFLAWFFRFINDWNDFTGAAVATGSYLATLRRRLRSNLRAADFSAVLYILQLGAVSVWIFRESNSRSPLSLRDYLLRPANAFFALGTVIFYVWLFRYRRNLRAQLRALSHLENESDAAPEEPARNNPIIEVIEHFNRSVRFRRSGHRRWL